MGVHFAGAGAFFFVALLVYLVGILAAFAGLSKGFVYFAFALQVSGYLFGGLAHAVYLVGFSLQVFYFVSEGCVFFLHDGGELFETIELCFLRNIRLSQFLQCLIGRKKCFFIA